MDLIKNGVEMKNCVWFNSEDMLETILNNEEIDVAFKLKMETYKDKYQYKIFIEDIKPSKKIVNDIKDLESLYNLKFPIKSIFYTRRDLENEKLNISFVNEEVSINIGRNSIGFLDNQTKLVLKKLNDYYGYKFNIKIDKIIRKDENYNVHIWIDKDYEFKTLSFETGKIFKEIKEFLIGDLEYNSLQKKVLKTIFKDKKNVVVSCKSGRGMDTVIKTIELYYKMFGKKVLVVKEGERREEGYDFYIYMGNEVLEASNYNLFITNNKIYCDTSEYIEDDYKIPSNVQVVDAYDLEYHENIFSTTLPLKDKKRIIESINKGEKIFTSEDIKIIL